MTFIMFTPKPVVEHKKRKVVRGKQPL